MIIEIDDREPSFIEAYFRQISTILFAGEIPVNIVIKRLTVGDWKIIDDDNRGLKTLVVERKHIDRQTGSNDMIASRNDGRWDEQNNLLEEVDGDVFFGLTGYWSDEKIECESCHAVEDVFKCKHCGNDVFLTKVKMEPKDRKSIITHMAGMNKRGILTSSFPTDLDLVYHSLKYFDMSSEYVPDRKLSAKYDKGLEFTARIINAKEGISGKVALAVAKFIIFPDNIGLLTAEMLSHLIRKVHGKEDQPMPLDVALDFYFKWHGIDPVDLKTYREKMGMTKDSCRFCTGKGKLFEGGFIPCPHCGGDGKKKVRN